MVETSRMIHEKEKFYQVLMGIFGVVLWIILLVGTFGLILIFGLIFSLFRYLIGQYFKAGIYGDSVKVNGKQFPEINNLARILAQRLNMHTVPDIFICNGNGLINAAAISFLSSRYVILQSDLVDLMLKRNRIDELSMVIGHEFGHHSAGHTSSWKSLLYAPAKVIPLLGPAYGRACELTADRIGFALTKNLKASQNALVSIALGSQSLANTINISEFQGQEYEIPELMGFLHKLFSTHPRMTKRVLELEKFYHEHWDESNSFDTSTKIPETTTLTSQPPDYNMTTANNKDIIENFAPQRHDTPPPPPLRKPLPQPAKQTPQTSDNVPKPTIRKIRI